MLSCWRQLLVACILLLWKFQTQEDEYRYDMRPMMKGAKVFWFKNQVWDNMLWSYVALHFWTFFECLMWYAYANGWATHDHV